MANKLAERLCRTGHHFICQMSYPQPGRWISFTDRLDFDRNHLLFRGIDYERIDNPGMEPPHALGR